MILYHLRLYFCFLFPKKLPSNSSIVLETYNPYFKLLDSRSRKRFLKRLSYFLSVMKWQSEPSVELRSEMKVLIGSGYIQLTFGLRRYWLRRLHKIFIAPKAYNYPYFKTLIIGDVNLKLARISLSWPAVKKGFVIEDDAVNVALHEFAHCMHYEMEFNEYSYQLYSNWRAWQSLAVPEILKIRNAESHLFSHYAGTNELEFFAVAIENFFERPEEFQRYLPNLYRSTSTLLNQDLLKPVKVS